MGEGMWSSGLEAKLWGVMGWWELSSSDPSA